MVSRTAVHALIRRAAGLRLPFALLAASALAGVLHAQAAPLELALPVFTMPRFTLAALTLAIG